jgi:hypothetical protein
MEPTRETEEELKELLEMTRENNEILHGMRRRERIGNVLKVLYLGFIILSFYGAYIFVQPYVSQVKDALQTAQTVQSNIKTDVAGIGVSPAQVQNILNKINGYGQQ